MASATASDVHSQLCEITSKTLAKLCSAVNRSKPGLKEAQNTLKKILNCNLGMGGRGRAAKTSTKGQGGCLYEDSTKPAVLDYLIRNENRKVSICTELSYRQ